jgi:hypothetical protein
MRYVVVRSIVLAGLLLCPMAGVALAETPLPDDSRGQWWTAWSDCDVTPVQSGPMPESIPGVPDDIFWLQGETTNDSEIEMIVWLWTGNRPLPLNGVYASEGMSTKWLWAFSDTMTDISAKVTNEHGTLGEVQFGGQIAGSSTGPINGWPSFAVVPESGCWTFEIIATAHGGEVYEGRVIFPAVP